MRCRCTSQRNVDSVQSVLGFFLRKVCLCVCKTTEPRNISLLLQSIGVWSQELTHHPRLEHSPFHSTVMIIFNRAHGFGTSAVSLSLSKTRRPHQRQPPSQKYVMQRERKMHYAAFLSFKVGNTHVLFRGRRTVLVFSFLSHYSRS